MKQQLQNDLDLELGEVNEYNPAIATWIKAGDNATADLLKVILQDEEGYVNFLETQLNLIKDPGLENYLLEQMGGRAQRRKPNAEVGAYCEPPVASY